jgi:uncharacterized protein YdgA (DUF945 family)
MALVRRMVAVAVAVLLALVLVGGGWLVGRKSHESRSIEPSNTKNASGMGRASPSGGGTPT